jgi:6-phosphogluconolactonase
MAAGAKPQPSAHIVLYASVGPELSQYDVDVEAAAIVKRSSVTLPGNVQEAWPHPNKRYLYVVWSRSTPGAANGPASEPGRHGISAFRIDPTTGALSAQGPSVFLTARPIHVSTDISGSHVLVAYNDPSGLTVHQIGSDGSIGEQVRQPSSLDFGIYPHQVRVDPSNRTVILVTRGNGPTGEKPEETGALKIMNYNDGLLSMRASIAPNNGIDFQARNVDYHPSKPWVFLSLERQNRLQVYKRLDDGSLSSVPLFSKDSLADPIHVHPEQLAGTVHVHPDGKFVYQANRATATSDFEGRPVFVGGENSIVVYSINQDTGEPTLVQHIGTQGMNPRTFAMDPSARILIAANTIPFLIHERENVNSVPASLTVFRVHPNGKLDFVRKYDVEATKSRSLFWMGLVALPE